MSNRKFKIHDANEVLVNSEAIIADHLYDNDLQIIEDPVAASEAIEKNIKEIFDGEGKEKNNAADVRSK